LARPQRPPGRGDWAAIRPVLVGFLICVDAFTVGALGIGRPNGWVAPFIAFGLILVGLVGLEVWAVRHRHDEPPLT
jgi:hypothetical protein